MDIYTASYQQHDGGSRICDYNLIWQWKADRQRSSV